MICGSLIWRRNRIIMKSAGIVIIPGLWRGGNSFIAMRYSLNVGDSRHLFVSFLELRPFRGKFHRDMGSICGRWIERGRRSFGVGI